MPTAGGMALLLMGKPPARFVPTAGSGEISTTGAQGWLKSSSRGSCGLAAPLAPTEPRGNLCHRPLTQSHAPILTNLTVLAAGGRRRAYAQLPWFHFSNNSSPRPLPHKHVSACLGQQLRSVSVIEITASSRSKQPEDQRTEAVRNHPLSA